MQFPVDHVHFSVNIPKRYSIEVAEIMLKSRSSKWIFAEHPGFRKRYPRGSFWSQYEHHQSIGHRNKEEAENYKKKIMEYIFGLGGDEPRTLEDIGKEFEVTKERIRQLEKKALRRLNHPYRSRKLEPLLEE